MGDAVRGREKRVSIEPMLSVRNGKAAVRFYKEAFAAAELMYMESPDGAVVAKLEVGAPVGGAGGVFWVADESPEHANYSPETLGGGTVRMVLVVADPDAVFARAVAAGGKAVWPVEDKEYGWRVGRLVDPFGHHWEIGREL